MSNSTLKQSSTSSATSLATNNGANEDNTNSKVVKINNQQLVDTSKSFHLATPQTLFTIKNRLLRELTRSIQLVQKGYLEKEGGKEPLTNSDYSVHELCQQFDYVFLLGLKKPDEGYWKLVVEFTHRDVINDLKALLNVTTNFGRGRAWIYHALNDNLMESYLRCFIEDKRLVNKYYTKGASLITDEQALTVLVTLVAGLENVEFKLQNDVPYLDHTCWPTHLNIKRHVVDSLLNSSAQSLSQLIDLNGSLTDSMSLTQSNASLILYPNNHATAQKSALPMQQKPKQIKRHSNAKKSRLANNISLDNSTTSSVNNLSDANSILNDYSVDEFSHNNNNNNMASTLPNDYFRPNFDPTKRNHHHHHHRKATSSKNPTKHRHQQQQQTYDDDSNLDSEENNENDSGIINRLKSESMSSSLEMDKLNTTNTSQDSARIVVANNELKQQQVEIDNEIDRLKKESHSMLNNNNVKNSGKNSLTKSKSSSFSSPSTNQELAASSLKASSHFDKKIEHIENYSQIIENATLNMDVCVKHMNSLYENYEKIYNDANVESDNISAQGGEDRSTLNITQKLKKTSIAAVGLNDETSVYDDVVVEKRDERQHHQQQHQHQQLDNSQTSTFTKEDNQQNESSLYSASSQSSLVAKNEEMSSRSNSRIDDRQSIDSSKLNSPHVELDHEQENNYLDDSNTSYEDDFRHELKVDNNTKLLLSIEIFQNGANEEFIKLYQVARGHSQGEIEAIFFMITTYGIYIMTKKEEEVKTRADSHETSTHTLPKKNRTKFLKESFINHNQTDYIEVSLCDQAFHIVCINKRQNCWITTASQKISRDILDSIQTARLQNKQLKFPKISIFHEATQQKLAIKKFISNEENLTPQDIEIKSYSLVFWEDQASDAHNLIHKEGSLYYYHKSSASSAIEWKKGYFVLKNDVLTKYKTANDKRPSNVIKLNGEDFSGCRRNQTSSKPNTIELILSNSNILFLAAKSEAEASDWLQSFCKVISLGNYHTDVPSNSCLPCCAVITSNKLYFCHEDLNTGFYRLLETLKLQEINRISFDNDNPFYCILHDDIDEKKNRYWYVYFIDKNERNSFMTKFKESWELLFQVPFTIEKCKSNEMRKRCIKGIRLIHKTWDNTNEYD